MGDSRSADSRESAGKTEREAMQPFVRNDDSKRSRAAYSLAAAFANAGSGFGYALHTQRNMKIHLCVAVVAVALGVAFSLSPLEWIAIAICICAVFALECLNTAVESVVDLVSPEYHMLAKHAKDCAAAAVFVAAIGAVAVEAIILLPRIFALLP